ncbi:MAG: hypothetical protein ABI721_02960 [Candidatus Dojkabacteria bacterium]
MGSDNGKYIIPFGVFVLVLNILLVLVLIFQNFIAPAPAIVSENNEPVVSIPSSFPVSFNE